MAVNGDAFEPRYKTDDGIRWHRFTAFGEPGHQLVDTDHQNATATRFRPAAAGVYFTRLRVGNGIKEARRLANCEVQFARV